jgi:hypothetical protein
VSGGLENGRERFPGPWRQFAGPSTVTFSARSTAAANASSAEKPAPLATSPCSDRTTAVQRSLQLLSVASETMSSSPMRIVLVWNGIAISATSCFV